MSNHELDHRKNPEEYGIGDRIHPKNRAGHQGDIFGWIWNRQRAPSFTTLKAWPDTQNMPQGSQKRFLWAVCRRQIVEWIRSPIPY
jgi:hypothetical protein